MEARHVIFPPVVYGLPCCLFLLIALTYHGQGIDQVKMINDSIRFAINVISRQPIHTMPRKAK